MGGTVRDYLYSSHAGARRKITPVDKPITNECRWNSPLIEVRVRPAREIVLDNHRRGSVARQLVQKLSETGIGDAARDVRYIGELDLVRRDIAWNKRLKATVIERSRCQHRDGHVES